MNKKMKDFLYPLKLLILVTIYITIAGLFDFYKVPFLLNISIPFYTSFLLILSYISISNFGENT